MRAAELTLTASPHPAGGRGPPENRRGRVDDAALWVVVGTLVVASALFWVVHSSLIDDAYIGLSYAKNLAFHFHWGLIRQETANSASSPLNVILMAAVTALVRKPVLAVGAVYVGANVVLAWWMTQIARTLRLPILSAALAVALVLLNPFVLSATGMETPLMAALLVGLLCATVQDRPVRFGILAGLALLTRVDLVIFVVALGVSTPSMRRRLPTAALIAALVSGPWFVWSWFHFGSAIPDSFVIKTLQHSFGKWSFGNGPFWYLERNAAATWLSFLPALLGAMALAMWGAARLWVVGTNRSSTTRGRWRRLDPVAALGVGGIAYYFAYSLLGVPAYQWYYCPVMVALSGSVALLLPDAIRAALSRVRLSMSVLAAVVLVFVVGAQAAMVLAHDPPWREPVIFGNWATPSEYIRVGEVLHKRIGEGTAAFPGEIGTLAFACDCAIVDTFSDRALVVPLVEERIARARPVTRFLLKLNYFNLSRRVRPRRVDYDLSWHSGPVAGPDSWSLHSRAAGVNHIQLDRRINSPVITAPSPSSSIVSGTTSLFTSADDQGVARVEYRVFGKPFFFDFPIGTATRAGCCRWVLRWDTRSVPNGDYRVVSLAFTDAGGPARSAPRSITVAN